MDRLLDVALEMDPQDGCLTVYDVNDGGTTAFMQRDNLDAGGGRGATLP